MPDLAARIVELKDGGLSFRKVADTLESKGILTPKGKKKWNPGTVQKIYKRSVKNLTDQSGKSPVKRSKSITLLRKLRSGKSPVKPQSDKSGKSGKKLTDSGKTDKSVKSQLNFQKAYHAALKEVDAKMQEINALRGENESLRDKVSRLESQLKNLTDQSGKSQLKPQSGKILTDYPSHVELSTGEMWAVSPKQIGKYQYLYASKRISGKLHHVSLGKEFKRDRAVMKIERYKSGKKV